MDGCTILRQYLGEDMRDLQESKPSGNALEQARFYLSLFKRFKLQQQG